MAEDDLCVKTTKSTVRCVKPDAAVVQLVVSLLVTVGQRGGSAQVCVRWQVHTQKHKPDDASDAPRSSSGPNCPSCRHTHKPGETGTLSSVTAWWCYSFCVCACARLRCLGREGENTRGCRRRVTRRTTASCGGALGGRSEDTAELSVDTRRGKRRRSRHTSGWRSPGRGR